MSRSTLLHLSLIPGIGPATVEKLVSRWTVDGLPDIYYASIEELHRKTFLALPLCQALIKGLSQRADLEKELELLAKYGISFVTRYDEDYPHLLKSIEVPPLVLYWKGAHPASYERSLAFVGSRKANAYAARITKMIIEPLASHNFCIVSGGALGADTLAHTCALNVGLKTVAVIGSGILRPYPSQNKKLFETLVDAGGTLLSPFPLRMESLPGNFPACNRIIAGLSSGCIVLQAAERSGALITARFALDAGREVGAVPGPIDDELSAGCNSLIAQGAAVITSADDVLSMLGYAVKTNSESPKQMTLKLEKNEDPVLVWCQRPIAFDELVEKVSLPSDEVHQKLFALQLEGKVEQNFMGQWVSI
jgi:DNA processing protein